MLDDDFERQIYRHQQAAPVEEGETLFTTFADRVVQRVDAILRQPSFPPLLGQQYALLRLLRSRVGIAAAMPAGQLCEHLQITPRVLKDYIHDLRLNYRVQIGASRDANAGGYYLIANEQESLESSEQLLHQAVAMLRVVRVLRSSHTVAELLGQVLLEMEGDANGR